MIKAVIFDIDGVLIDSFEANHKFFCDLLKKFGHNFYDKEEYRHHFHVPMKGLIKHSSKLEDEEEIEKIWRAGRDKEVPYPHKLLTAPEQMNEIIEKLSKDYKLGIVSGRVRESIYSVPQLKKLEEYFKVVVAYQDTDNHKPHPDPLLLAAQKLGISPEECVYIGDAESDIVAAKAAGMKSIMYARNKSQSADVSTSVFSEIPELILKL